ncbi:sodium:solute symporter [Flavipsychrobacter stenotrophus]|uniref:Sodium:solute symporter n=1 Tax=Flavipsychrobacter stenotrophus TaxID=2077091 RepID=A0A2S7SPD8_9BACT|nr:sodium:solute symporter [Flavipsychrobacter stenotrophus]PQJ08763.1 sodium:solute symporter [Flavipsychrobacter stenotrophus]
MSPVILLSIILIYFAVLLGIAFYTSRNSSNESFFIGNRNSKWWLVAFGMIGTSLSGMTFISVPGTVGLKGFDYFQVVIGYWLGYFAVAFILLPLYYKLKLTSIYTYLEGRLGGTAYKTGALFFILSRTLGATLRLYLVIKVLEKFVLEGMGIPFEATAIIILGLILLYTYRGGVKTIVWTDTLQTTFMLLALIICVGYILHALHLTTGAGWTMMQEHGYTKLLETDPQKGGFFLKQILGGAFITIAMTGLDQEMMQKNISVSNVKDSQKNMLTLSFLQAFVVFIFLMLGGLLYLYGMSKGGSFQHIMVNGKDTVQFLLDGKNIIGDNIFPELAFHYMPPVISVIFIIGLISALFPSADGALTALTSSFCIDILGIRRKQGMTEAQQKKTRMFVHYTFAVLFLICVFIFRMVDNGSLIQTLLVVAGYTYGPLLALFVFGIFTNRNVRKEFVPIICIAAPVICYMIKQNEAKWLGGYQIGTELLIINASLTFLLLLLSSKRGRVETGHVQ